MKRIFLSSTIVGALALMVVGATGAFFNDTETSEGNIMTAGSVDLRVDHLKQTYNGLDCETCTVMLYSDDGNTQVVAGDNTTETSFPFAAPEVSSPISAWDTHPTADWIWATDPTVVGDDGSNGDVTYTFERTFQWNGPAGSINFDLDVGGDNSYVVYLNGTQVAAGSGFDPINTENISSNLVNGQNTLTFEVTNEDNAPFNSPAQNPGGLLYFLEIEKDDCFSDSSFRAYCQLWEETDLDGSQQFFNFYDIKPGDYGTNVISLHVYDNPSYACLIAHDGEDDENGLLETEGPSDDESAGELQNYVTMFTWIDENQDGEYDPGSETALDTTTLGDLGSISSLEDFAAGEYLTPTTTEYIGLAWCAGSIDVDDTTGAISCDGSTMLNDAQSDQFTASLSAYAEQTRNNDQFSCANVDLSDTSTGPRIGANLAGYPTPELEDSYIADHVVDSSGDGDFLTIQAAVDAAGSGDNILVRGGTYTEEVTVSVSNISLLADNVVDGTNDVIVAGGFSLEGNNITLGGFHIQGGMPGIPSNPGNRFGVRLGAGTAGHQVIYNRISDISDMGAVKGVHVFDAANSLITHNLIENIENSDDSDGAYGVLVQAGSTNTSVTNNTITDLTGNWSGAVVSALSSSATGIPSGTVGQNIFDGMSGATYAGVGFYIDSGTANDATLFTLAENNFRNTELDLQNKDDATLTAENNWFDDGADVDETPGLIDTDPEATTPYPEYSY